MTLAVRCVHHWRCHTGRRRTWARCLRCFGTRHFPTLDWKCSRCGERTGHADIHVIACENGQLLYLCPHCLAKEGIAA